MHCSQKLFKRSCHNCTLNLLKLNSRGLQQVTSVQNGALANIPRDPYCDGVRVHAASI